jgi:16S rRNA (uracil1498-N3)-methyltransferase
MRQCGRFAPPELLHFATLDKALHFESQHPCVFGDVETRGESAPTTVIPSPPCRVAVGPEGGWTRDERSVLTAHGASPVQLSPWVLRTPTAALAIVAKSFAF